ncbi:MAG: pyruvate kinase [Actinomycetota bacterium]|jgi:pyruvate kinase|nr:pyruvate kinase [Actinomycetota bacterium]PLS75580.1 MAG: pyruvate kinase [Actinomycetota bacterium]
MSRRTKIVATVGPACDSPEALASLMEAGVDVVRLGFAHSTADQHLQTLARVRAAAAACDRVVGILADLPGPKVRTGPFPDGTGALLAVGHRVTLVPGEGASDTESVSVDYPSLLEDLGPGDRVALGDGSVVLGVEEVTRAGVVAMVHNGGWLKGRPGVHLPAERMRVSSPTTADLDLLAAITEAGFDMVAISFVQTAGDIERARAAAGPHGPMIVAKIETRAAVENLTGIIDVADAVMIARGDLGVECAIEEVPHLQKHIIRTCVAWGRPVITATQMLESMVYAPTPTRAEASDIANAVFDGADALMLSAETAIGHDPVGAVRTMARIATRAEREADYVQWGGRLGKLQRLEQLPGSLAISAATSMAAWQLALSVEAAAILCCTRSGATARAIARFRPTAPLIGLCPVPATARQLTLTWGLLPVMVPEHGSTDDIVWLAVERVVEMGLVHQGETVVVLAGNPADPDPVSDDVRVVRVR